MNENKKMLNVGLVMPIAPIDGCSAEHWIDVRRIIHESLSALPEYTCDPKIVSEGNSVGLIHKRIVEGLYTSDIIICDVSCKNPNVMFELGMRLAFDKPTVIIKDDQTDYSFDTGVIEHIPYPRDLRYKDVVEFKDRLAEKVKATFEDSLKDPNHSPFLKSFGTFKVASLKESEVSADQFIIGALRDLQNDVAEIKAFKATPVSPPSSTSERQKRRILREYSNNYLNKLVRDYAGPDTDEMPIIDSISDLTLPLEYTLKRNGFDVPFPVVNQIVLDFLVDNGIPFNKR